MALEKVLKIENAMIAGFLYNKMLEAKKAGIEVSYKVELEHEYPVSEVWLAEVIGILFDHATANLTGARLPEKKMYFKLRQKEENITIKFAYISKILSLDEMIGMWGNKGNKTDLYRLRQLAEKNNGEILVKTKAVDDINYLCIKVKLPAKTQAGKHIFCIHKVDSL